MLAVIYVNRCWQVSTIPALMIQNLQFNLNRQNELKREPKYEKIRMIYILTGEVTYRNIRIINPISVHELETLKYISFNNYAF